jgi:hypothetical protein
MFVRRRNTMPTLLRTRRTSTQSVESAEPTEFTESADSKRPIIDLQDIKLPKVDLPEIEIPKVDVGKAVLGVATAAGLVKRRRSRWPYLLGAGVVVAVAAWAVTNAAIRERLTQAVTAIGERVQAMRGGGQDQEPMAFPAAQTAPINEPANLSVPPASNPDYPEGFGAENQAATAAESPANNGHETATAPR